MAKIDELAAAGLVTSLEGRPPVEEDEPGARVLPVVNIDLHDLLEGLEEAARAVWWDENPQAEDETGFTFKPPFYLPEGTAYDENGSLTAEWRGFLEFLREVKEAEAIRDDVEEEIFADDLLGAARMMPMQWTIIRGLLFDVVEGLRAGDELPGRKVLEQLFDLAILCAGDHPPCKALWRNLKDEGLLRALHE